MENFDKKQVVSIVNRRILGGLRPHTVEGTMILDGIIVSCRERRLLAPQNGITPKSRRLPDRPQKVADPNPHMPIELLILIYVYMSGSCRLVSIFGRPG